MQYISILRGINVSGQKQIKMADLKLLYEELGFRNVVTYIQSGNVIFSYNGDAAVDLKFQIEKAIEAKYKFFVPVIIRTKFEILDVINNCPFDTIDLEQNGTKILVTFLSESPPESTIDALMGHVNSPEEMVLRNREVYLYCPNGYGKTKLSNSFIERKLGVVATTRNWKSTNKLYELCA